MNDVELDQRLGVLLRALEAAPDQAFVDRMVAAARLDRDIRQARQRALRRGVIDCAGAVAVAATFFLLSQSGSPPPDGIITLQAPAMAGLVMLGLWAMVSLPMSGGRARSA